MDDLVRSIFKKNFIFFTLMTLLFAGGSPYQAETKMVLQTAHIPQFQPGAEFPVKIAPDNPQNVVLDIYGQG